MFESFYRHKQYAAKKVHTKTNSSLCRIYYLINSLNFLTNPAHNPVLLWSIPPPLPLLQIIFWLIPLPLSILRFLWTVTYYILIFYEWIIGDYSSAVILKKSQLLIYGPKSALYRFVYILKQRMHYKLR